MRHLSLFSGIGGFDLAARWMGWDNIAHVEKNPFCRKVLKYHFPNSKSYEDVKEFKGEEYRGTIDVLSGGFPCQPFSSAGKRKGTEDDRHLWPEMLRIIREVAPRWIVGENVRGLINWNGGMVFEQVQSDLEAEGYEVQPFILPACGVNAPHRRDRVWFIAYSDNSNDGREAGENERKSREERLQKWNETWKFIKSSKVFGATPDSYKDGRKREREGTNSEKGEEGLFKDGKLARRLKGFRLYGVVANGYNKRLQGGKVGRSVKKSKQEQKKQLTGSVRPTWENFPVKPALRRGDDGVSGELDGITFPKWRNETIKAYGNAVVPHVVYQLFKVIEQIEQLNK